MKSQSLLPLYEGGSNGKAYAEYVINNDLYQSHKTVEDYEWDLMSTVPTINDMEVHEYRKHDIFWFQFLSHMEDENLDVAL